MHVRRVLPADAIPSIDEPRFDDDHVGTDDDEVVVLELGNGPARAYPVRILNYHEIVNDQVDGRPVAVTWCPLCGSAVVYDRRVDGDVLAFGVSGKLADDDLVMYDRETGSEWKQSLGECIDGVHEGASLTVLPATVTTYGAFRAAEPDGLVLQPAEAESEAASEDDEPAPVDYDEEPYRAYFEMDGFGLDAHRGGESREWDRTDLEPKTVTLGLAFDDEAVGVPLPTALAAGGVVRLIVGDREAVVLATESAGIHAYADPGFALRREGERVVGDGTRWEPASGESDDGRTLERLPARRLFAFAWQDDHGPDAFLLDP